jgi:hypothetical protein
MPDGMSESVSSPTPSETSSRKSALIRKIVLNVHIYGGLLCFSYLILFGISVLNFNHPFPFTQSPSSVATWAEPLVVPGLARTDGKSAAEAVNVRRENERAIVRSMGSFAAPSGNPEGGWVDGETYHAHFVRPGKAYDVDVRPGQGSAKVTQTRAGVWSLIRDLHGSVVVYPESALASTWRWYTELCTFVVVAAGVSGVYLWVAGRRERRIGLVVLAAAAVVSVGLMLLVSFAG